MHHHQPAIGTAHEQVARRNRRGPLCIEQVLIQGNPGDITQNLHLWLGENELQTRRIGEDGEPRPRNLAPSVEGPPARVRTDNAVAVLPKGRHCVHIGRLKGVIEGLVRGLHGFEIGKVVGEFAHVTPLRWGGRRRRPR